MDIFYLRASYNLEPMKLKTPKFSVDIFARESVEFFIQVWNTVFLGLKNYWKVVLVVYGLFGSIYYFKARKTQSYFESKASFTFNFVHKKVYGDMFFYLQELTENKHTSTLATVLQIPTEVAGGIRKLEAKNIVNSPLHQDFTFERIPFYVYLDCENKEDIPLIQKALVNYVWSDSANNVVANKEIEDYRATLKFVIEDLRVIDSLIKTIDSGDSTRSIELLYLAKERQKEKISLENRLSDKETISVLSDFKYQPVTATEQNRKKMKKFAILAAILSLLSVTFLQWYNSPKDEV